jgi:hypothetical protein
MRSRRADMGAAVSSDRGDTLIEILVTVAIVSISVAALLGGVLASTTASTTHQNMTTVDAVLKTFAETARNAIETQASDGNSGPQYVACATGSSYQVVSAPYPNSGPVGSVVTVFGTGFGSSSGAIFTSSNGTSYPPVAVDYSGTASGATASFAVPAGLPPGTYTITPFDSSHSAATAFKVLAPPATASTGLAFQHYQLNTTVQYWTGTGWTGTGCTPNLNSNLQQLTYQLVDSQPGNGASDQLSVVLANFKPLPVPTLTVTCSLGAAPGGPPCASSTYSLGTPLTFTATVTNDSNPTGTISWSGFPTGEGCSTPQSLSAMDTATCSLPAALRGSFQPTATYSGDATESGVAAALTSTITITPGSTSVKLTDSGSGVSSPSTLTFTAQVNGIVAGVTPTGNVTWNITTTAPAGLPGGTTCLPSNPVAVPTSAPFQVTCTVPNATSGSYTVSASYSGDNNYLGSTSSADTVVVWFPGVPTVSYSPLIPTVGNQLTFSATITRPAGAPAPTGTITWSGTNLPASCTSSAQSLPTTGPYTVTCTIPSANRSTYSATATYSGDANYSGGSGSVTAPIALYAVTPTLTCTGCQQLKHSGGSFTITATIAQPNGAPVPTGTVTWTVTGKATSCTGGFTTTLPASPGPYIATCTITNDSKGSYNFSATYSGDTNYAPETSVVLTETVQ